MQVLQFKLNLSREQSHAILDRICNMSNKNSLRERLKRDGIEGRSNMVKLWSWSRTYNIPIDARNRLNEEKTIAFDKMLEKKSIEDWLQWYSGGNLRTIEHCCSLVGKYNAEIHVLLNPADEVEQPELLTEETF